MFYLDYNGRINIDMDAFIVSMWNESCEYEEKIFLNDKEFFENEFESSYDAAWAVSMSSKWGWTDTFAYFDSEGCLTSFSHWDDENCPIKLDKIDISNLINTLQKLKKLENKKGYVNNVPRAIQDALQEV